MRPTHPHNPSRRTLFITLALSLGTLTTGCATLQTPEESLQQRAQAFWDARKINDELSAYKYEAESLQPGSTLQNYLKGSGRIEYRSVEIKSVKLISPTEGEALVAVSYALPGTPITKPFASTLRDQWTNIDGRWYHIKPPKSRYSDTPQPKDAQP